MLVLRPKRSETKGNVFIPLIPVSCQQMDLQACLQPLTNRRDGIPSRQSVCRNDRKPSLTANFGTHLVDKSSVADNVSDDSDLGYSANVLTILGAAHLIPIGERTEGRHEADKSPFPKQPESRSRVNVLPFRSSSMDGFARPFFNKLDRVECAVLSMHYFVGLGVFSGRELGHWRYGQLILIGVQLCRHCE